MIDFPSSPSVGQIFNSGTGPIYVWDGVAWSLTTTPFVSTWEPIGKFDLAGLSQKDVTGLGAFSSLRFMFNCILSTTAVVGFRASIDNGATYNAGASDYSLTSLVLSGGGTVTGFGQTTNTYFQLSGSATANYVLSLMDISDWNKPRSAPMLGRDAYYSGSATQTEYPSGFIVKAAAANAMRVFTTSGTFTSGTLMLEGLRG